MKKVLIIIGIVIGSLFIFGVVLKIVDPEGVERRASKRMKDSKQAEQAKQGIFEEVARAKSLKINGFDQDWVIAVYTPETNKKKIKKFAERYKKHDVKRLVLVIFFNDEAHIPNAAQLKDWWVDGSVTVKTKTKLFKDYFVACYRIHRKVKNRAGKTFRSTEFLTTPGNCGLRI